jgi:hypothetical protein
LPVADNARDVVLLHVSASSERQECGNKTEIKMTKNMKFYSTTMSMYNSFW